MTEGSEYGMNRDKARATAVPSEVSQAMRAASHYSWAVTPDRTKRTAPARAKFQQKFLDQAGGDPVRAESLRKAFYASLALKSAQTRRRNREARQAGAA
jgi:hypothetical protein